MNLLEFMELHPLGHDFLLCSKYNKIKDGFDSRYDLIMYVEWIENKDVHVKYLKSLKNFSTDINIDFELYED